MDEVQAMTHAGETVGRAMGTGLRTLRRGAVGVGHSGAEAAARAETNEERKLATSQRELMAGTSETRRRWPWLLALLGIAAAGGTVVAVVRSRSSTEPAPVDQSADPDVDKQQIAGNGTAPRPRPEQAQQKEFDRKN